MKLHINNNANHGKLCAVKSSDNQTIFAVHSIEFQTLTGESSLIQYHDSTVSDGGASAVGSASWEFHEYSFRLTDEWHVMADNHIRLTRHVEAKCLDSKPSDHHPPTGIHLTTHLRWESAGAGNFRFFVPSCLYTYGKDTPPSRSFMDDRMAYPMIVAYNTSTGQSLSVSRHTLPTKANRPVREPGQLQFLQETDIGSLGYLLADSGEVHLTVDWPYHEGPISAAIDSSLSPCTAFYPLPKLTWSTETTYDIFLRNTHDFATAAFEAFEQMMVMTQVEPVKLPFSTRESIDYRLLSLAKTYKEWADGEAGFFINFDPRHGYDSAPSGFGTSFHTIPSNSYDGILEYGFTGRQLNAAYTLVREHGSGDHAGEWIERGQKVINTFVKHCVHETGFVYSLYNSRTMSPVFTIGNPDPTLQLHYVAIPGARPGNYLRCMVEPMSDLLLNYQLYQAKGQVHPDWLAACIRFGDFLLRIQNPDGSWYRAYEPDGTPLHSTDPIRADSVRSRASTAVPVAFLVALGKELADDGERFLHAAKRAGDYVMEHHVQYDHYHGGTLDNPNVVDKEAAMYAMSALVSLHEYFRDEKYLIGAVRAAKLAVTWNFIWDVPHIPGTPLDREQFKSRGFGGINSIWGGGAVDIYSLFYVRELKYLSAVAGIKPFDQIAQLIITGTQQLLSHPKNLMGFTDIGMQPEGFGLTNQGIDEGQIAKGDIWGTLGWIYSAGSYGILRYFDDSKVDA
ncbi:MAG: AGE family epimerase/isomerase [Alicyclobacillus sp.]|nr:AGE family epimerase/isomerase [Alicyclobacillus sp.]